MKLAMHVNTSGMMFVIPPRVPGQPPAEENIHWKHRLNSIPNNYHSKSTNYLPNNCVNESDGACFNSLHGRGEAGKLDACVAQQAERKGEDIYIYIYMMMRLQKL